MIARYQAKDGRLLSFSCFMTGLLICYLINCCKLKPVKQDDSIHITEIRLCDNLAVCNQHTYLENVFLLIISNFWLIEFHSSTNV